jgi:Holliday junction resolvase RusA-like endonuclease
MIELKISPVTKPRMTRRDQWYRDPEHPDPKKRQRPGVTRYFAYRKALQEALEGELDPCFDVTFFVPMPKSWSAKEKAAMDGKPMQVKPDVDNYLKAFMDSLCKDDSYIYDAHPRKFWAYEGKIQLLERGK